MMELKEERCYFTALLAQLITHANSLPGIRVALDEGKVTSPRPMWVLVGSSFVRQVLKDAIHESNSYHYNGLAVDLLIYRDGLYISDGDDPIYQTLDSYCRSLDHSFGLGIHFHDSNHVSLGEYTPVVEVQIS